MSLEGHLKGGLVYIVDDYKTGKVYIGETVADLLTSGGLPIVIELLLEDYGLFPFLGEDWKHCTDFTEDFYFGSILAQDVMKYLADRDASNLIVGV